MTIDDFACFKRKPFSVHSFCPPLKDAELLMKYLGFSKVEFNCVYEGPVENLITGLRALGFEDIPVEEAWQNPYLLKHPQGHMVFNYAESASKPSDRFIAYFRAYE